MKLSPLDSALLKDLYETDGYQALVRMLEAHKLDIAVASLNALTLEQLYDYKGQVRTIDWLINYLQKNYVKKKG